MDEAAALALLGLAQRAGQVTSGDGLCEKEIRAGRAALALLDAGASENTREKYAALCGGRGIPLKILGADALGQAIGKGNRMIAVVKPGGLAKKMETLLS
ncbi:MAG: ribosomal L7Ae/L30e/S12e/Gadd45 family protein [Oscillospiraceae bacterium]|jgi:ribosomal protein L7Ae-like RNA K-turn-binding protein|nr:ribosomal L7Ae/L30e/S12e/Gadd45 family protein [Oscillospiraceae bacterium]